MRIRLHIEFHPLSEFRLSYSRSDTTELNQRVMNNNLDQNKKNAVAFYRMAYEGNPARAVEIYVGGDYARS